MSDADARLDVDDGTTTVTSVEGITFGAGLTVTDDGDGTVTIDGSDALSAVPARPDVDDGQNGWSGVSAESQNITGKNLGSAGPFGRAVAVGRDSQTALLGAPREEDSTGDDSGAVYAFYGTE